MDRKEFFQEAIKRFTIKGIELLERSGLSSLPDAAEGRTLQKVRPPGAAPKEKDFLSLCTGCDACMAACPINAIMIEDLQKRDPLLYPEQAPCIHCPGYPCISACPTGALDRANGTRLRVL